MRFPVDHPFTITTEFSASHHGLDIAPPAGVTDALCYAPENGHIIRSDIGNIEGNFVTMLGESGARYYFGHFSERHVATGQVMREGDVLGVIGMTGAATGIHTHHETQMYNGGPPVDPRGFYGDLINGEKPKEEDMPNEGDVHNAYLKANGRKATAEEVETYTTKPWSASDGLLYGKIFIDLENLVNAPHEAPSSPEGATELKSGLYLVK